MKHGRGIMNLTSETSFIDLKSRTPLFFASNKTVQLNMLKMQGKINFSKSGLHL